MAAGDVAESSIAQLRAVNERLLVAGLQQQAARQDAEQLAAERGAVLAQLSDGVVIVDPDGRVTFVNETARRLDASVQPGLTLAAPEAAARAPTPAGHSHPLAAAACRALRGETVIGLEILLRHVDGAERTVRSSSAPLRSAEGRLLGAVVTLQENAPERAPEDTGLAPDFVSGDLAIQYRSRYVTLRGQPVKLSRLEYELLYRLVSNAGRILPAQTLLERIWGANAAGVDYVKVYIRRLRRKLEPLGVRQHIETVRGLGYRFVR